MYCVFYLFHPKVVLLKSLFADTFVFTIVSRSYYCNFQDIYT